MPTCLHYRVPRALCVIAVVLGTLDGAGRQALTGSEDRDLVLWYETPASQWVEALAVGNGRLGGMVFGGTEAERIQLNEDTLWVGEPRDYTHPGAADQLPTIRRLLFEGKQREAERLAMETFMSVPLRQMPYQPLGDLKLSVPGHETATDYRRELDIDRAVATVRYRVGDTTFTREILSSAPDDVLVVRVTADRPGQVTLAATLSSPHADVSVASMGASEIALRGRARSSYNKLKLKIETPLRFEARVRVVVDGGSVESVDGALRVRDSDSVTFLVAAATSYRSYRDVSADPTARCEATLAKVEKTPYESLRAKHIQDHQGLFRRVKLDLGTTAATSRPTPERIKAFRDGNDPQLAELYFQFGRYLLIASSRPGSQPATLQGLWNESMEPPWEAKYTVNINTEMNYWPAEVANLPECHEPLFKMIEDVAVTGRRTARVHYGCAGWVLHHNTDLWRGSAPINNSNHGIWVTGGAWLSQHLWWHYEYSLDKEFLRERAYPILKEAALFFADFLVEDPRSDKGWLISTPSNSPEQGGLVAGPTMDHQIIRELFSNVIEASRVLGVDEDLRAKLVDLRGRIAPNQIGKHGQLQEWLEDKDDPNNRHRHISHLWGLHPGRDITARGTPELFEAARKSLEFRGDGGTGWSKAWKVNFWARLLDGNHAYKMLSELVSGSTLPNLFDTHPPFQIDGNFGGASGISEMLLQTHAGEIHLLPALPDAWPRGSVSGLMARGAVEIAMTWEGGRLTRAELRPRADVEVRVRIQKDRPIREAHDADNGAVEGGLQPDGSHRLRLRAGQAYTVIPN